MTNATDGAPADAGRFVVLRHDWPVLHYDLMLEAGSRCRTWRLLAEPVESAICDGIPAERIADHRVHYLSYEGPVGGDRGAVRRWDAGTYRSLDAGRYELEGARLRGRFAIRGGTFSRE